MFCSGPVSSSNRALRYIPVRKENKIAKFCLTVAAEMRFGAVAWFWDKSPDDLHLLFTSYQLSEQVKIPVISVGWGRRQWPSWSGTGKDLQVSPTRHAFTVWTWVDHAGCNSSHLASVREYLVQTSQMGSLCSCLTSISRPHACFSSGWLTLTKFLAFKAVHTHLGSLPISLKNSRVFQWRVTLQSCFGSVSGFLLQRDHSLTCRRENYSQSKMCIAWQNCYILGVSHRLCEKLSKRFSFISTRR